MILSKDELLESIKNKFADDTSDDTIKFIEDISDTLSSYDGEDWKSKYEQNDKEWREKYKNRFFNNVSEEEEVEDEQKDESCLSYDDLIEKLS